MDWEVFLNVYGFVILVVFEVDNIWDNRVCCVVVEMKDLGKVVFKIFIFIIIIE